MIVPNPPPTLTSDLEKSQNWLLKKWHVQSSPWRRHCWLRKRFDESLKIIAETFQFLCSLSTKKTVAQKFLPKLLICAISLFWFSFWGWEKDWQVIPWCFSAIYIIKKMWNGRWDNLSIDLWAGISTNVCLWLLHHILYIQT